MATTSSKSKKTAATTPRVPSMTHEIRLRLELSMMVGYVRDLMPKAEAAIKEFRDTALTMRPDYAITSYAERGYHGQFIQENFTQLAFDLKTNENAVDVLAEITKLRNKFRTMLMDKCFTHNSTSMLHNALNIFKGQFAATYWEQLDRMIQSYESYAKMTEEEYNLQAY